MITTSAIIYLKHFCSTASSACLQIQPPFVLPALVASPPPNPHRRPYLPNIGVPPLRPRSIFKPAAPTAHVTASEIFCSDHESPGYT
ncbi:hypothetical protein DTO013E5_2588 [Penicillium roqueforti]|nr:hypothetical protein CBS147372_63 [Penicillium roqueforti]KAI2728584.1 hypothetical protein CBS147354_2504 [Penicillium roqueforti]KAI2744398.1 hypothetical protein DTO012A1_2398 [Penicillium roqueforti]KAI2753070.1 hypothetical protein DTO013F2_2718 [Penicillium roqueforti]KAI2775529.1 hypothetical protein DTO012A8_260 [Penicillium roqueforti]